MARGRAVCKAQAATTAALAEGLDEYDDEDFALDKLDREARLEAPPEPIMSGPGGDPRLRTFPLWPGIRDQFTDFGGLMIPKRLSYALEQRGITAPSEIQAKTLPVAVTGESVMVHAPTGSGKTLAYLLPMLARLQPTVHVGVQVVILVPTPELALQIARQLTWLIEVLCGPERVCWFNPQVPREMAFEVLLSRSALWDALRQDTAILVSTAPLIASEIGKLKLQARRYAETLQYFLVSNLQAVVLDEVDTMFRPGTAKRSKKAKEKHQSYSHPEQVVNALFAVKRHRYRNAPVQLYCASATANCTRVSRAIERMYKLKWPKQRDAYRRQLPVLVTCEHEGDELPRLEVLRAQVGLSPVPADVTHALVTLSDEEELVDQRFQLARFKLVSSIVYQLDGNVVIFVPEKVKLDAMVLTLREAGILNAFKLKALVGLSQEIDRTSDMDELLSFETQTNAKKKHFPMAMDKGHSEFAINRGLDLEEALQEGEHKVMVCKASRGRGMDLQDVKYVVNFDLPPKSADYLHLAGRTGRMGHKGTCITLVTEQEKRGVIPLLEDKLGIKFGDWDIQASTVASQAGGDVPALPRGPDRGEPVSMKAAEEEEAGGAVSALPRGPNRGELGSMKAAEEEEATADAAADAEAPGDDFFLQQTIQESRERAKALQARGHDYEGEEEQDDDEDDGYEYFEDFDMDEIFFDEEKDSYDEPENMEDPRRSEGARPTRGRGRPR